MAGQLHGISIYLLGELAASADARTTRDEIDRYNRIARAAADLRAALHGQSSPGRLLGPIAQSISRIAAENAKRQTPLDGSTATTRTDALPSNLDTAHSICMPGWLDDAHPLAVIERIAKQVAADLVALGGRGGGNLHARTRMRPETAFGVACGQLLEKQLHEPPSISETGKLYDLMARVWRYATGSVPPPGLGHHAKAAARRIWTIHCVGCRFEKVASLKTQSHPRLCIFVYERAVDA